MRKFKVSASLVWVTGSLSACGLNTYGSSDGAPVSTTSTSSGASTTEVPTTGGRASTSDASTTSIVGSSTSTGGPPVPCEGGEDDISVDFKDDDLRCAVDQAIEGEGNPIDCVFTCAEAQALTTLTVQSAKVAYMGGLHHLINLEVLNLIDNKIEKIVDIETLTKLTTLSFLKNKIISVQGLPDLPNLTFLDLGQNSIQSLSEFPQLPELRELYLSSNLIDSLSGLDKEKIPKLDFLSLGSNKLSSLEEFPDLDELDTLYLNSNRNDDEVSLGVSALAPLEELEELDYLNLGNNNIHGDDLADFPDLPALTVLYLSGNAIQSFAVMPHSDTIEYLGIDTMVDDMGKNHFDVAGLQVLLDNDTFPDLNTFNLQLNNLTAADLVGFPNFPKLTLLYLDANLIETWAPPANALASLQYLSIGNNPLTDIVGFADFGNLQTLKVNSTSLDIADISMLPTQTWVNMGDVIDVSETVTNCLSTEFLDVKAAVEAEGATLCSSCVPCP